MQPSGFGDTQRGFSQLMTDTLSADGGTDNHRSQERAIRIEFYGGSPSDLIAVLGHDHRVDVLVDPCERKMFRVEQSADGRQIGFGRGLNHHERTQARGVQHEPPVGVLMTYNCPNAR